MDKQFVTYEIAKKLKELGFNESCLGIYYTKDGHIRIKSENEKGDAPLWQQVIDWFRIEHKLLIEVYETTSKFYYDIHKINHLLGDINSGDIDSDGYSYEDAREQGILKALELIK